jgi:hypothetical protein
VLFFRIAALSVDDEPATAKLTAAHGLTSRSATALAPSPSRASRGHSSIPARSSSSRPGFVLSPAGQVLVSVYANGAIGRLVPEDVIGLVRDLREHQMA